MKQITKIIILFSLLNVGVSCKKKDSSTSEPTVNIAPATPTHTNTFTAKVNGQDWTMYPQLNSTFKFGSTFMITAQSSPNNPYTVLELAFTPTTGIVSFSKYGPFYAKFNSQNNWYSSLTGTMNIIEFDTSASPIKKFRATFSFQTDTISSQSFTIAQGSVDYIKP